MHIYIVFTPVNQYYTDTRKAEDAAAEYFNQTGEIVAVEERVTADEPSLHVVYRVSDEDNRLIAVEAVCESAEIAEEYADSHDDELEPTYITHNVRFCPKI